MLENDPGVETTYVIHEHFNWSGSCEIVVTEKWLDHTATTTHRLTSREAADRFIACHPLLSTVVLERIPNKTGVI